MRFLRWTARPRWTSGRRRTTRPFLSRAKPKLCPILIVSSIMGVFCFLMFPNRGCRQHDLHRENRDISAKPNCLPGCIPQKQKAQIVPESKHSMVIEIIIRSAKQKLCGPARSIEPTASVGNPLHMLGSIHNLRMKSNETRTNAPRCVRQTPLVLSKENSLTLAVIPRSRKL